MKGKKNTIAIVLACFLASCLLISSASAISVTADPSSFTLQPGSTVDVKISVDSLPEGLAGYSLRVSVPDPAAGTIVSVKYPGWGVLNNTVGLPSSSVVMSAVDIMSQVGPTNTPLELGTVTIRSDNGGSSQVIISNEVLDADGGGIVINENPTPVPTATQGNSVVTGGSGGYSGGSSGGSSGGTAASSSSTSSSSTAPITTVTTAVTNGTTGKGSGIPVSTPVPKVTVSPVTTGGPEDILPQGSSGVNNQVEPTSPGIKLPVPMWIVTIVGLIAVIAAVALVYLAWSKKI